MLPQNDKYEAINYTFLRAEALCADLLGNGFSFKDLVIKHAGSFKKSYRNDVESLSVDNIDGPDKARLEIELNRDGIYDRLPEGLFHQSRGNANTSGLAKMVEEYKRYRDEEKNARKFFHPLDQELFRYSVLVEQEERNLQMGMLRGSLEHTFNKFWDIPAGLPGGPASVLARIMPWLHRIKGDRVLTAKALGMMLELPVSIKEYYAEEQRREENVFRLGDGELGVDTVVGNMFMEPSLCWEFTIEDVPGDEIVSYTNENPHARFLKHFTDVFIPIEIDAIFVYELETTANREEENVLGYSLTI